MKKLILPILILLSLPLLFESTPTEIIKLKTFDALIKTPVPSGNFVILNITEEDIENNKYYEWDEDLYQSDNTKGWV